MGRQLQNGSVKSLSLPQRGLDGRESLQNTVEGLTADRVSLVARRLLGWWRSTLVAI